MKVLFLDVDGVLNSKDYMIRRGNDGILDMDKIAVDLLVDIVEKTGCKIVVSSSWRFDGIGEESRFVRCLRKCGAKNILDSIIDHTPINNSTRGDQIQLWLDDNKADKFVIVDDDICDMGDLKKNAIKTDFAFGLTRDLANKIIKMFN